MTKEEKKKELEKLTKPKLVEMAAEYPDIVGAHGMNKDQLIEAIKAEKVKTEGEAPAEAPKPAATKKQQQKKKGPERPALKARLKELRQQRRQAMEAKDGTELKRIRQRYKKINRSLRRTAAAG